MEDKDLQSIKAEIERKRLEIEQEIEDKKRQVEAEIASRREEMEHRLATQRLEMERRYREQMQVVHREINARDLAAKIETESLTPAQIIPPKQEDPVERGIRMAKENHPVFMIEDPVVAEQPDRENMQPTQVPVEQEQPEQEPSMVESLELEAENSESGLQDKVKRLVKRVMHRETPEEIAQDIAKQEAQRALRDQQLAEREVTEIEEQPPAVSSLWEEGTEALQENPKEECIEETQPESGRIEEQSTERRAEGTETEEENVEVARKEKKSRWIRIGAFVTAALLVAMACFYGTVFVMKHLFGVGEIEVLYPSTQAESETVIGGGVSERLNVLVLGTDYGDSEAEKDEPKRTDAMLLVSVDPKLNQVAVLSIPRDTKVILTGHVDPQKINAAYAFGGVMLAKQTVSNLLGVPITHYAMADWQAFSKIVDLIGGVDLQVAHDMKYDDPYADLHIDIKAGYQHMDGKMAGQYVRYRSDELGDIGRAQRQQAFIRAVAKQMCKISSLMKIPTIVTTISDYVETDLSFMNMVKLINSVKIFGEKNVKTGTLAGEFQDENGISYWQTSEEAVQTSLQALGVPSSKVK